MEFYKLSEAATHIGCDALDLLKAGAKKEIKLHVWCGETIERVVIIEESDCFENEIIEIPVYIKDEQEDMEYSHLLENRFYEIYPSILWGLYMSENPGVPIPWGLINVEDEAVDQLYVKTMHPIKVSIGTICILEKDFSIAKNMGLSSYVKGAGKKNPSYAFTKTDVTKWEQVVIRLIDFEYAEIVLGEKTYKRHYKNLGFGQKNRPVPKREWLTLVEMVIYEGYPPRPDDNYPKKGSNRHHVNDLKQKLKKLFPTVEGEPWDDYKRGTGWPLNIKFVDKTKTFRSERNH